MAPRIRHDVVVLADSDMRVDPRLSLARRRGAAKRPASARVTCLYYGVPVDRRLGAPLPRSPSTRIFCRASWSAWRSAWRAPASARPLRFGADAERDRRLHRLRRLPRRRLRHRAGVAGAGHARSRSRPSPSPICARRRRRASCGGTSCAGRARSGASIPPVMPARSSRTRCHGRCIAVLLGAGSAAVLPALAVAAAAIGVPDGAAAAGGAGLRPSPQSYWLVPARDLLSVRRLRCELSRPGRELEGPPLPHGRGRRAGLLIGDRTRHDANALPASAVVRRFRRRRGRALSGAPRDPARSGIRPGWPSRPRWSKARS